ncbi:DUF6771 family protein [Sphingomonas sp. PAMC 26605]|uniref:DUF6771 family protein n=1 Tax=Sphingomonas sp. PAMC 26605 TaxID=1112214 RepID=UPI001E2F59DF|nr:DUF6771 family protein [Sphingomonas sp. PAMC 26605]
MNRLPPGIPFNRFIANRLARTFCFCSIIGMARFAHQPEPVVTPDDLAATLLTLPGWVRVGLSAPDKRMRFSAAEFIVQSMIDKIADHRASAHPDQLDLSL